MIYLIWIIDQLNMLSRKVFFSFGYSGFYPYLGTGYGYLGGVY
jgi:hypothetical protein